MIRAKVKLGFGARKTERKRVGDSLGAKHLCQIQKGNLLGAKKCGFPARLRGRQPGCPGPVQIKEGNMSEANKA